MKRLRYPKLLPINLESSITAACTDRTIFVKSGLGESVEGLERDGTKIACKICVTCSGARELGNIVKCLTTGQSLSSLLEESYRWLIRR